MSLSVMPSQKLTAEQLAEIRKADVESHYAGLGGWINGARVHRRQLLGHLTWLEGELQTAAELVDGLLTELLIVDQGDCDEYRAAKAWLQQALESGAVKVKP